MTSRVAGDDNIWHYSLRRLSMKSDRTATRMLRRDVRTDCWAASSPSHPPLVA
jgi:hypothetical protein